jgi:hypothetical protein
LIVLNKLDGVNPSGRAGRPEIAPCAITLRKLSVKSARVIAGVFDVGQRNDRREWFDHITKGENP